MGLDYLYSDIPANMWLVRTIDNSKMALANALSNLIATNGSG